MKRKESISYCVTIFLWGRPGFAVLVPRWENALEGNDETHRQTGLHDGNGLTRTRGANSAGIHGSIRSARSVIQRGARGFDGWKISCRAGLISSVGNAV